jgi:hypothetical protein
MDLASRQILKMYSHVDIQPNIDGGFVVYNASTPSYNKDTCKQMKALQNRSLAEQSHQDGL